MALCLVNIIVNIIKTFSRPYSGSISRSILAIPVRMIHLLL